MHQLELSLQQRAEQLSHLERQSEQSEWRRGEELRKREDRVRELQLELDRERGKEPVVKVSVIWKDSWSAFERTRKQNCSIIFQVLNVNYPNRMFFSPSLSMSPKLWRWNHLPHWSTWLNPDRGMNCCLKSCPVKMNDANSWKSKSGSPMNTAVICSTRWRRPQSPFFNLS